MRTPARIRAPLCISLAAACSFLACGGQSRSPCDELLNIVIEEAKAYTQLDREAAAAGAAGELAPATAIRAYLAQLAATDAAVGGKNFGSATADAISTYRHAIESMRTAQEALLNLHAHLSDPDRATTGTGGFGSAALLLISHEEMAAARTRVGQACGVDTR